MIVSNQGYTLAQANRVYLDLLNQGNATLAKLETVGLDCSVAKRECAEVQRVHAQELAELTEGVKKLDAIFKKIILESDK